MAARNDLIAIPQLNNYSAEYAGDSYGLAQYVGDIAGKTGIAAAIALLRKFGSDAHLWLPGVGTLNGLTCGNYLDSAGTTLGTVDNPVGLVLDACGAVGSDVLDGKGSFASAGNWYAGSGWSVSGGKAVATAASTTLAVNFVVVIPIGKTWQVTYTISNYSAGNIRAYVGSIGFGLARSSNGTFTEIITSTGSANIINILGFSGFTGEVSNFSVREVTGTHATQSTTANKPVLRRGIVNRLTYSGDFTNAAWTKVRSSITTGISDPYGGTAASKIVEDTSANSHPILNSSGYNTILNSQYTAYCVVKMAERTKIQISTTNNGGLFPVFDLSAGTASGSGASIASIGGGWYLCASSYTAIATSGDTVYVWPMLGATNNYQGDGASGVYIYRAGLSFGTLTAQQILDNGGIPLTTTAAASNASAGKYFWSFDGTNDSLALGSVPFQMSDDHCVVAGAKCESSVGDRLIFSIRGVGSNPIVGQLGFTAGSPDAVWRDDTGTIARPLGGGSKLNETVVISARQSGVNKILRVNGSQPNATVTTALGVTTVTTSAIGLNPQVPASYMSGSIGPVIAIKGTVTDADLLLLERFVAALTPNAPTF